MLEELKKQILEAKKIAIFPTARIDLDCISSAAVMLEVCKFLNPNAEVSIWCDFSVDNYHKFIAEGYTFNKFDEAHKDFTMYDLGIIVDGVTKSQLLKKNLGKVELTLPYSLVLIDHHSENNTREEAKIVMVNSKYRSATAIIWDQIVKVLGLKNNKKIVTLCLAGYLGDTQYLRWTYNAEDIKTFEEMVECGGDLGFVNKNYFRFLSYKDLQTCFKLVDYTRVDEEKGYYFVVIPLKFEAENKLTFDDFGNIKDYYLTQLQNTSNWKLIVTIKESPKSFVWVSMRSSEDSGIDCSQICRNIAEGGRGGGHERSAGANFKDNFDDAYQHVKDVIDSYLQNRNP
ncbi:MAG: DHH family phosphoesterase [bacterium]